MSTDNPTIGQTVEEIRAALRDYIEATYHVGHPAVVQQRRELLDEVGVIGQIPYLESTPRYTAGPRYEELGLPEAATRLLSAMSEERSDGSRLLFNPPYDHQARALQATVLEGKSLVVTTGTGSGKTESFLLPILARLADEASSRPTSFQQPAVRALVLYPMNALVNDQLGRLRLMLGDPVVAGQFMSWAGRPSRFARYTSRTLYPGVRTSKKDTDRLKAINHFYIDQLDKADLDTPQGELARDLISSLQSRGKWPAKPDLRAWYGTSGTRWQRNGAFVRAVTRPEDAELFTRHEVLAAPPDVLVTNYSMLEYMLMRPLERPVFDATKLWLDTHPDERLLLVVDEAHLYRGASGAEVGLLLRRFRARLGLTPDRLQVICTSASFSDQEKAVEFAAALSGKQVDDFRAIEGKLALRGGASPGSPADAEILSAIDLDRFYASDEDQRLDAVRDFLSERGVVADRAVDQLLYDALESYPPMSLLVNETMTEARPLGELAQMLFKGAIDGLGERALTALIALGSAARPSPTAAGLLPCRVHTFFRGLPGLWACSDPGCPADGGGRGGPVGRLYAQPQDTCDCGARVFEFFTCRHCGTAYLRAYTDDILNPSFLWSEPGREFESVTGVVNRLEPLDLCLEEVQPERAEPADIDLITGRINPWQLGDRTRHVFIRRDREPSETSPDDDDEGEAPRSRAYRPPGEYRPCGVCGQQASFGRSSVQDHQTKGDEPFQALVTRQLQVQPPGRRPATEFAPLRGRKVLAFSDSRQTAARLAPNLQTYAMRDVLRPLILLGLRDLLANDMVARLVSLEDLYLAVLLGADRTGVRLRPALRSGESMQLQRDVELASRAGELSDEFKMQELFVNARSEAPPASLLLGMYKTVTDRWYGLQSLALASITEHPGTRPGLIANLPALTGLAESDDEKLALVRLWIAQWTRPGIWFPKMPGAWWMREVKPHKGNFKAVEQWIGDKSWVREFKKEWVPILLAALCEPQGDTHRIRAARLTLDAGPGWGYCGTCRTTQRPFPGTDRCIACRRKDVRIIDPDQDPVFRARKEYYRLSTKRALGDPMEPPIAIVAAEHTAQLGTAQADEVFSKAEEHELLFQDVDLGPTQDQRPRSAIDVLSCTTTMEVGIDIGTLSGVALRNMPPSRASYQQRAGRAGRRGDAVATVLAFGSADSHDEHYFREPDSMIRGRVDDPILSLDNSEIAKRHVTAFLFQRYHADRLPHVDPEAQPQLFEVLGKVDDFIGDEAPLNRGDFGEWLVANRDQLAVELEEWLPEQLPSDSRVDITSTFVEHTLHEVDRALELVTAPDAEFAEELSDEAGGGTGDAVEPGSDDEPLEAQEEAGDEASSPSRARENLLDRLLYKGVLPRYAFPTDVVAFHVFDNERSTVYRPVFEYAPSQGLPVALTQYAPGKDVWVDGKLWRSGAIYSPMRSDRYDAWTTGRIYFECRVCHYAMTESRSDAVRDEERDCPACGAEGKFGKARNWIRPPGFAHPYTVPEGTSPDDQPPASYATRAKLVASFPSDAGGWVDVTDRIRQYSERTFLLVTNTGPQQDGYTYCLKCGLIEPTAVPTGTVHAPHPKPYPDRKHPDCPGGFSTRGLVLGTDFVSDVLLIALRVDEPLTLVPGYLATQVALRTVAEALTLAATERLEIEPGELQAEYRPALTDLGKDGLEAEIYLYDTLAGGAGFARHVAEYGRSIYEDALRKLEGCAAGCDRSCYRCLRSFRNRFEHDLLDRFLGASLLRYLLFGTEPVIDHQRLSQSTDRLYEDLARQGLDGVSFRRNVQVEVPGIGDVEAPILAETASRSFIVALHGPLTPDFPATEALREAKEYQAAVPVLPVDEIVVARNLPAATRRVMSHVGS